MNRLLATIRCDVRLQWRNGFYYASLIVVVLFSLLLRQLPRPSLIWLLPVVIVNNLVVNAFYFMGGLVLLEKGEGTLSAQVVTPLRSGEYLLSKIITLTALSLVETLVLVLATYGWPFHLAALVTGVLLGAAFYTITGFIVVARYDALNEYILPSVVYAGLLALPLLPYFGVGASTLERSPVSWLLYLHPLQPMLVFLGAMAAPISLGQGLYGGLYAGAWILLLFHWSRQTFHRFVVRGEGVR